MQIQPLQIDVSAGGVGPEQYFFALGLLAILGVILAALAYRQQYVGLPADRRRHKRTLLGQREDASPATLRIDSPDDLDRLRPQIRALFDSDPDPDSDASSHDRERATVWSALSEIRGALGLAWRDLTGGIPRLSIYLLEEAVIVAVLGSIAVQSTHWFQTLFTVEGGPITLQWLAEEAVDATLTLITAGIDILTLFPHIDVLYALAVTLFIELSTRAYEAWFVTAALLVLAAVVLWRLADRVPDEVSTRIVYSHTAAGLVALATAVVVWAAGVIPFVVFRAVGHPETGATVGFVTAALVALVIGVELAKRFVDRLRRVGRGHWYDPVTLAYLAVQRGSALFAAALVPIVVGYAVVVVSNGKLVAVIDAFSSGSLEIQAAVIGALAVVIAAVILQTRAAWPEVRAAIRETLSRRAVRVALFGRAVPLGVVLLAYFVALNFTGSNVLLAGIIAVVAGVIARVGYELLQRARYRASLIESSVRTASRVLVGGYRFADADGRPIYYAEVNTTTVAHTSREACVDAVIETARQLFERGDADPSIAGQFADDLYRYGIVSVDETERRLTRKVWEDLVTDLRDEGGMCDVEAVEESLQEYPESVRSARLRQWRIDGDLRQRNGYYILNTRAGRAP